MRRVIILPLLGMACLLIVSSKAAADPIVVPFPLDSPVSVDLNVNPVVTFGTRTIDFTSNLNQEFIAFLPTLDQITTAGGPAFRSTIAVRARNGLSMLTGMFPPSPDPGFINQVPTFPVGTTNLLAFDVIVPGWNTPFSVSLIDVNGSVHSASFGTPTPEPASLLLLGAGLGLAAASRRRRKQRTT